MNEYVGKHVCTVYSMYIQSNGFYMYIQSNVFLQLKIKFLCFRKKTSQSHLNQITI